jgi:hypothetical protein
MASTGAARARVGAGLFAVAVSVALALLETSTQARFEDLVRTLAITGIGATAFAVVTGWSAIGVAAALALGAGFASTRFEASGVVDLRVVLVAPGLLLLCELVSWSCDAATSRQPRGAMLGAIVVIAAGVTAVLAALTTLPVGSDVGLPAAGVTAVAVLTATFVRSARSAATRA